MTKRNENQRRRSGSCQKPVSDWVHFRVDGEHPVTQIGFSEDGRLICPQAASDSIVSYRSYDRASGKEKVIFKSPGGHLNYMLLLQSEYDAVAGVDTNDYVLADGRQVSICASFASRPILKNAHNNLWCDLTPAFIFESVRPGVNPEVIGWHMFMTYVVPLLHMTPSQKLALFVDSELDEHANFNQRKKPYFRHHFLPTNVQLHFGTADTGTELPNQLIKACDKQARDIQKMIDAGSLNIANPLGGPSEDYAGFAYVNFTNSPYELVIDWDERTGVGSPRNASSHNRE